MAECAWLGGLGKLIKCGGSGLKEQADEATQHGAVWLVRASREDACSLRRLVEILDADGVNVLLR